MPKWRAKLLRLHVDWHARNTELDNLAYKPRVWHDHFLFLRCLNQVHDHAEHMITKASVSMEMLLSNPVT